MPSIFVPERIGEHVNVRHSEPHDLEDILRIYASARAFMRDSGNPDQWGDSWPPDELAAEDIEQGRSLVIEADDGVVRGVFAFILGEDPTYSYIEDGAWLNDEPYATIHRIASDGVVHGVFGAAVAYGLGIVDNLRVDTHENNSAMQRAISREGFERCGIIYIEDGTPRIAYQLCRG